MWLACMFVTRSILPGSGLKTGGGTVAKSLAKRKAAAEAPQLEKVPMKDKSKRIFNLLSKPKEEERKAYRPRGYRTRKFGTVVFWIMFGFIFLIIAFSALGMAQRGSNAEAAPVVEAKLNMATTPTAVQYAENFAREYFNWKPGTEAFANREKRLAPYLAKGLDKHAGLQSTTVTSTSIVLETEVVNIEEKGENQAYITLRVDQKLGLPKEVEEKNTAAQKKAATAKTDDAKAADSTQDAAKKPKASEKEEVVYETKNSSKFFVVPVAYSTNYGVYDLPKFTYVSPQTTVEVPDKDNGLPEVESAETKQNIRNFLDTFFDSYAQDPADKLAYLLEDPEHPNGLNKRMSFISIKSSQIYQGDTPTSYIVFADALLEDPVSKDRFVTNYRLDVTQKDTRYVVSKIDQQ